MIKKGDLYFPSKEFQKKALLNSAKIYQETAKNPVKFWEKLAKEPIWREQLTEKVTVTIREFVRKFLKSCQL